MPKEHYQCVRCGYTSNLKDSMKKHFYKAKKVCPASQNDIQLTEEIKQYILTNRRYHLHDQKTANQIINNYNQINAFISNMDAMEKILKYTDYKQIEIKDFDDMVDEKYQRNVSRLENDSYKMTFHLRISDLLEIFNNVTGLSNGIEYFNTFFDEKANEFKIMSCGEWKTMLLDTGIKEMIETVKKCYLDMYEVYLIRKMKDQQTDVFQKTLLKERLVDYYKFLACFDISPCIVNKDDNKILYNSDDFQYHKNTSPIDMSLFSIQDEYIPLFRGIRAKLTNSDIHKMQKDLKDILKKNARVNILDLNKKMVELFQMDEQFKATLLSSISNII